MATWITVKDASRELGVALVVILLVLGVASCGESEDLDGEEPHDDSDDASSDGETRYSGITEVDETMHFRSVDPDDWRDA